MSWFRRALAIAQNILRRRHVEQELEEEVQSYAQLLSDENVRRGLKPREARRMARMAMGGVEQVKEEVRSARAGARLEAVCRDLCYGARMLYKKPGFTAVAVITLALGIGANSAIFSVMNASLLAPVPVSSPDRVVMAWTDNLSRGWHEFPASAPDYLDWKASGIFRSVAAIRAEGFNLRIGFKTERVEGLRATSEWFDIMQPRPILGRFFHSEDMRPGRERVAVLGYSLWTSRFGADPGIVGRSAVVNGQDFTIIGVLPKNILTLGQEVLYTPLVFNTGADMDRGDRHFLVAGRLADGLSFAAAQQRISVLGERLAKRYPQDAGDSVRLQPAKEAYVEDIEALVLLLLAAVAFVLLVACANIANLLLVRGTARRKEMAVRAALGASRSRLACQLVSESIVLALFGGAVGLLPAWAGIHLIASFKLDELPRPELVTLDGTVVAFTFVLATITGVLFGLVPAWQLWRSNTSQPLKETERSHTTGPQGRVGNIFVAGEIALTVVLLAGAGLMLRSFVHIRSANPGYDTTRVLTMRMTLSGAQYDTREKVAGFYNSVVERLKSLPGVRSAAVTNLLPASDDLHGTVLFFAGHPEPKPGQAPVVLFGSATPDYFAAMHIPVIRGRSFNDSDRANAPLTAIIDQEAATKYWNGQDPVGKLIKLGKKEPFRMVVGVVGNVEQNVIVKLTQGRVGQVYLPFAQAPKPDVSLILSSWAEPQNLTSAVRAALAAIDPDQPLFQIQTLGEAREKGRAPARIATLLLGFFAVLALLLAAVGIYGVISYTVGQRTREIGIRMALGATNADLLKLVLGNGGLLICIGAAVGLLGAFGLTRLMRSLLSGVSTNDPITFAGVTVLLVAAGLTATYIPARRASRVDPSVALRCE